MDLPCIRPINDVDVPFQTENSSPASNFAEEIAAGGRPAWTGMETGDRKRAREAPRSMYAMSHAHLRDVQKPASSCDDSTSRLEERKNLAQVVKRRVFLIRQSHRRYLRKSTD